MSPLRSALVPLLLAVLAIPAAARAAPMKPAGCLTMKAVRIHDFGGLDVLRLEEVPRPQPGPGEVLVRVHAAGVNPVDRLVREGAMRGQLNQRLPLTLGWDVSGVVEETGPGVARLKKGDAIYAHPDMARDGAYAEFMVVRESEAALKPRSLGHVQAAAVPLAGLVAWQALYDTAQLQKGQTVLIHGAAGGVGTLAVQLAKARGAYVIATASARNHAYLRLLGADQVLDYHTTRFEEVVSGVDVVLDPIGEDTLARSFRVLKRGGVLVSLVEEPPQEKARAYGVRAVHVFVHPSAQQLTELARLIDAGRLAPHVSDVLPLADARRAHERGQSGHARGKLVLRVAG